MKQVKRWRYYCDHCKKSSGTRHSMAKHEKGCTANPNRVCGLCLLAGLKQRPMVELTTEVHRLFRGIPMHMMHGPECDKAAAAFREFCGNCPACILATMRQASDADCYMPLIHGFDFRAESKAFLAKCLPPEDWS